MTLTATRAPELQNDGMGGTLRALRIARGWSLADLASASGVPASTLSKIENGLMHPSLVHAINLAESLEANLGFLTSRGPARAEPVSVVRTGRRQRLDLPGMGLTLMDLHGDFASGVLEARAGTLAIGARSGDEAMTHPGEEICHVLSGAIRYFIADEVHDLFAGDTIHFFSTEPHRWENAADDATCVVWVFSDGLSF
jgi:transcriptional regulator with XRE-family HTH domain